MSVSLVSLSIGSDDTPLTLATLEADAVELVAARLTAGGHRPNSDVRINSPHGLDVCLQGGDPESETFRPCRSSRTQLST